jgi:hypothetical protein
MRVGGRTVTFSGFAFTELASVSTAIRNERTTTQTDPFQANPLGVASWLIFFSAHSLPID